MRASCDPSAATMPVLHAAGHQGPCACPTTIGAALLAIENDAASGTPPLPGLSGLLDRLFHQGIPCLVVTTAPRSGLARLLDATSCAHRLPMRICREDVAAVLPDPAALRLAAQRLALPIDRILVIADGTAGCAAAQVAGCMAVALDGGHGAVPDGTPRIARLDEPPALMTWAENHQCFRQDLMTKPLFAMAAAGR